MMYMSGEACHVEGIGWLHAELLEEIILILPEGYLHQGHFDGLVIEDFSPESPEAACVLFVQRRSQALHSGSRCFAIIAPSYTYLRFVY